jgi:hypothetical protein
VKNSFQIVFKQSIWIPHQGNMVVFFVAILLRIKLYSELVGFSFLDGRMDVDETSTDVVTFRWQKKIKGFENTLARGEKQTNPNLQW